MNCLKRLKILLREWKEWNGKVFEMKALDDEMKEINLNLAFDITFAITNGRLLYSFIKENFTWKTLLKGLAKYTHIQVQNRSSFSIKAIETVIFYFSCLISGVKN